MDREREIAAIRARLARLDIEKAELEASLTRLLIVQEREDSPRVKNAPVTNASPPAAKIALFRSLFRGREDVFPKRWDNTKTGKAGYAPACANEWVPRICGKPKVKCGECLNRAFFPVTDDVIDGHLRGHHTVGVYPMLADEMCWFLRPIRRLGKTRRQLLRELDRPALKLLPIEPYVFAEWRLRRVGIDYRLESEHHFYSVPHSFARCEVEVRLTARTVGIFVKGKRIASHMRGSGNHAHTTLREHMPSRHRRYADWTIDRIRQEAARSCH